MGFPDNNVKNIKNKKVKKQKTKKNRIKLGVCTIFLLIIRAFDTSNVI